MTATASASSGCSAAFEGLTLRMARAWASSKGIRLVRPTQFDARARLRSVIFALASASPPPGKSAVANE